MTLNQRFRKATSGTFVFIPRDVEEILLIRNNILLSLVDLRKLFLGMRCPQKSTGPMEP